MTLSRAGLTHLVFPGLDERICIRVAALSRWENEGGAAQCHGLPADATPDAQPLTNAELVQLLIRVIALENVVIALLARAPSEQLALVQEMAAYISPRPGFSPHPMMIHAATELLSLVDRADRFRPEASESRTS